MTGPGQASQRHLPCPHADVHMLFLPLGSGSTQTLQPCHLKPLAPAVPREASILLSPDPAMCCVYPLPLPPPHTHTHAHTRPLPPPRFVAQINITAMTGADWHIIFRVSQGHRAGFASGLMLRAEALAPVIMRCQTAGRRWRAEACQPRGGWGWGWAWAVLQQQSTGWVVGEPSGFDCATKGWPAGTNHGQHYMSIAANGNRLFMYIPMYSMPKPVVARLWDD